MTLAVPGYNIRDFGSFPLGDAEYYNFTWNFYYDTRKSFYPKTHPIIDHPFHSFPVWHTWCYLGHVRLCQKTSSMLSSKASKYVFTSRSSMGKTAWEGPVVERRKGCIYLVKSYSYKHMKGLWQRIERIGDYSYEILSWTITIVQYIFYLPHISVCFDASLYSSHHDPSKTLNPKPPGGATNPPPWGATHEMQPLKLDEFPPICKGCNIYMCFMGVSKNRGTPKWMVYNGKPLLKWIIWGYHYFRKHPSVLWIIVDLLSQWTMK